MNNKKYIVKKIITILTCFILLTYINIGMISNNKYIESKELINISENQKIDNNEIEGVKVTSRGNIDRLPKSKTYIVYKLIIENKELFFYNKNYAEEIKNKLLEDTENLDINIIEISQNAIDNLSSSEEIENIITEFKEKYNKNKTYYPTISKNITSYYGYRKSPIIGASSFHKGIDIGGKYGDNIYSYKSGIIISAIYSSSYGNMILIKHNDNTQTRYAHLSSLLVKSGDIVQGGQIIGKMGSTGISTGNHLHFEIIINNLNVNPYTYIF